MISLFFFLYFFAIMEVRLPQKMFTLGCSIKHLILIHNEKLAHVRLKV